jgi:hypothetical protein
MIGTGKEQGTVLSCTRDEWPAPLASRALAAVRLPRMAGWFPRMAHGQARGPPAPPVPAMTRMSAPIPPRT